MKTLALIIGVAALALLFFHPTEKTLAKTEALNESASPAQSKSPEPTATPFAARAPSAKWSDQRIAQGRVVGVNQDGIVFMCEEWTPPGSGFNTTMDPSAGAGEIRAAAEFENKAAQKQLKERYGELLAVRGGILGKPFRFPTKWQPERFCS